MQWHGSDEEDAITLSQAGVEEREAEAVHIEVLVWGGGWLEREEQKKPKENPCNSDSSLFVEEESTSSPQFQCAL